MNKHIRDILISALGAALVAGASAFFSALGAHIGGLMTLGGMFGGAFASLRTFNYHA